MDSFGGPSASQPRTAGKPKHNVAFGATSDEQPLLRDGVSSSISNRIGRGHQLRDLARSAFGLSLVLGFALLGVVAISLTAHSSTTMPNNEVALSAPLGFSTHAVALSAPLGDAPVNRTFTVHTCGIPQPIIDKHLPFTICRAKLVGCPGGGGASCRHWRYEEGLEMTPTGTASNAFTITTDTYHAGTASSRPLAFFSDDELIEST